MQFGIWRDRQYNLVEMQEVNPKSVSPRMGPEPFLTVIKVAGFTTIFTFATVDWIFSLQAPNFQRWRTIRTEFAFITPSHCCLPVAIILIASVIALRERKWHLPLTAGALILPTTLGGFAYLGPGYLYSAVQPLVHLGYAMLAFALLMNFAIVIYWIEKSNRRSASIVPPPRVSY